eukprot:jgi/Mesvir1/3432/Mv11930-RA.1
MLAFAPEPFRLAAVRGRVLWECSFLWPVTGHKQPQQGALQSSPAWPETGSGSCATMGSTSVRQAASCPPSPQPRKGMPQRGCCPTLSHKSSYPTLSRGTSCPRISDGSSRLVLPVLLLLSGAMPLAIGTTLAGTSSSLLARDVPEGDRRQVSVGVYVLNVGAVDLLAGTFDIDFYMYFSSGWGYYYLDAANKADSYFPNSGRGATVTSIQKYPHVANVTTQYRVKSSFYFGVDTRRYPFEHHALEVRFEDPLHEVKDLSFNFDTSFSGISSSILFPGFNRAGVWNYSRFVFTIHVERPSVNAFIKGFFPPLAILLALWLLASLPLTATVAMQVVAFNSLVPAKYSESRATVAGSSLVATDLRKPRRPSVSNMRPLEANVLRGVNMAVLNIEGRGDALYAGMLFAPQPLITAGAPCGSCGLALDTTGTHYIACMGGQQNQNWFLYLHAALLRRRGYLLIDVSVARLLSGRHILRAAVDAGAAAAVAERDKFASYGNVGPHRVIPFVLEEPQGHGPQDGKAFPRVLPAA